MSRNLLEKLSQVRLLVVGDVMLDRYWFGEVNRISPEAPVPVVRVTRQEERMGGAANVAYNIVTIGARASLLSVVGDDEASHQLEALVAASGITPCFGRDPQLKTTVKLRVIGRQQQLRRTHAALRGVRHHLAARQIQPLHRRLLVQGDVGGQRIGQAPAQRGGVKQHGARRVEPGV